MNRQWVRVGVGKWIGAAAAMLLLGSVVAGETYYVAPGGNDAWSGLLAEANADKTDGPLATLDRARQLVRVRIANGLKKPVTVQIRGGEYQLDQTVVFGPEDSGTEKCPITYQAYPGEKPVFTGAKKLSNWKPCGKDPAGLPEAARGKLWVCDIPADLKGKWRITTLYDGLTMLPRSQSDELKVAPNRVVDDLNAQPKNIASRLTRDQEPITFTRTFIYQNEDLREWPNINDIEIFISPKHGWLVNMLPLAKIDPATKTATFAVDSAYQVKNKDVYRVENAIDHLDQEGEWVYNSNEGRIYIWPGRPLAQADIRAPFLQEFILVEGVEDGTPARFIHFKGLAFHHGLRDTWHEGDIGLQHDWEMYDKGNAIYLSCMGINNHLTRNYIHEFGSDRSTPMRLDDNSTFTYFQDNVCVGSKKGFSFKAPAEVRNNFFINVEDASIGPKPYLRDDERVVYSANLIYNAPADGEGKVRIFWNSLKDKKGVYRDCLLFSEPAPRGVKPGDELIHADFLGDPMLDREAMKKRIYRFKPGSPCEKLGIRSIDLRRVGSTLTQ